MLFWNPATELEIVGADSNSAPVGKPAIMELDIATSVFLLQRPPERKVVAGPFA